MVCDCPIMKRRFGQSALLWWLPALVALSQLGVWLKADYPHTSILVATVSERVQHSGAWLATEPAHERPHCKANLLGGEFAW